MKLIDILVKELPKRGGWPEGAEFCFQDPDREIRFKERSDKNFYSEELSCITRRWNEKLTDLEPGKFVNREQYEAALNAKPQLISTGKHSASLEQFINAGWTGSQLIEHGYFRHIKPGEEVEELPGLTCEVVPKPENGVKHDGGKFRFTLLPWNAVKEVIDVLEFGAKKYAPDNWKRVDDHRDRYFNATIRHVTAWYAGEKNDPETGLNHLAHAVCCLLFLIWFDKNEQK